MPAARRLQAAASRLLTSLHLCYLCRRRLHSLRRVLCQHCGRRPRRGAVRVRGCGQGRCWRPAGWRRCHCWRQRRCHCQRWPSGRAGPVRCQGRGYCQRLLLPQVGCLYLASRQQNSVPSAWQLIADQPHQQEAITAGVRASPAAQHDMLRL